MRGCPLRLVLAALLMSEGMAGAQLLGPKYRSTRQREAIGGLLPVAIDLGSSAVPRSEPQVFKLRVYASRDYRRQTFQWKTRFERLVERVNHSIEPWPGMRFIVMEARDWEVDAESASLAALLDALAKQDPGKDVDWVVGLAPAIPVVPTALHQLGIARPGGRHFILRSLHDLAEEQVIARYFDELTAAERSRILAARKAHKEEVVFLHEWAHTLGAIHAVRPQFLMNPTYDNAQTHFCPTNARIIALGMRYRSQSAQPDAPQREMEWRRELRAVVGGIGEPDWDPKDRDELLAWLDGRRANPSGPGEASSLPVDDDAQIERALTRLQAQGDKDLDETWQLLQPLLTRYPRHTRLHLAACHIVAQRTGAAKDAPLAERVCRSASQLLPDDPRPQLLLARSHLAAGRENEARAVALRASTLLEAGPKEDRADDWRLLASIYQRLTSPTLAERAAGHIANAAAVTDWARLVRRRLALPATAAQLGLPPEREWEYLRSVEQGLVAAGEGRRNVTEQMAEQLRREFPRLPGGPLLDCALALKDGRLPAASQACQMALAQQEDLVTAHRQAAAIAARQHQLAQAILHLGQAIELDPQDESTWGWLAGLYREAGQAEKLKELQGSYEQRFGKPLGAPRPPTPPHPAKR